MSYDEDDDCQDWDEDDDCQDWDDDGDWDGPDSYELDFADPGGNSALRAESASNPRNLPCPTCGEGNRLTPKDVALHYQCDTCSDRCERGW